MHPQPNLNAATLTTALHARRSVPVRLYDYAASGNCYKVRLALAQLGMPYERVPIDIFAGDTLTDEFGRLNPARTTPVLVRDDGADLPESAAILLHLAEGTALLPDDPGSAPRSPLARLRAGRRDPGVAGLRFRLQTGRAPARRRGARAPGERRGRSSGSARRAPATRDFLAAGRYSSRRHRPLRLPARGRTRPDRPARPGGPGSNAWRAQPGYMNDLEPYPANARPGAGRSTYDTAGLANQRTRPRGLGTMPPGGLREAGVHLGDPGCVAALFAARRRPPRSRTPTSARARSDLDGKLEWMYAPTPEAATPSSTPTRASSTASAARTSSTRPTSPRRWHTTTGRPDVTIAVLDSGIKWNDLGAMIDLRLKTRINRGEPPPPQPTARRRSSPGVDCAALHRRRAATPTATASSTCSTTRATRACDPRRPGRDRRRTGRTLLDPQDVLIAFSDGADDDGNGYVDDIVGWDFLDDDNDPFDDVQYGHGTGEARDSTAEANNGGDLGTCPNCMVDPHARRHLVRRRRQPLRAGRRSTRPTTTSLVVQEALGTLNKSRARRDAVKYAYDHGVDGDRLGRRRGRPAPQLAVVRTRTRSSSTRSPSTTTR